MAELIERFKPLYDNDELRKQKATISSNYVSSKTGATDLIVDFIKKLLHQNWLKLKKGAWTSANLDFTKIKHTIWTIWIINKGL